MKINKSINFFAGQDMVTNQKGKETSKHIFGGNLNLKQDLLGEKRKQAREQAMKVVTNAFANEEKIDSDLQARKDNIRKMGDIMRSANDVLKGYEEQKVELKEAYGIADDSQEQKDLELLIKERKAWSPGSDISLTEEEKDRLEELKLEGRTEYQERVLEIEVYMDISRKEIEECNNTIIMENAIITGINLERLKTRPMLEAKEQAEDIMKAASDEIISMATKEAMEHIDREFFEKVEEAKEKAEEEKIEEEKLEALKEKKEEMDVPELPYEDMLALDSAGKEVKMEIDNIIQKMSLVEEDIKGALVDKKL